MTKLFLHVGTHKTGTTAIQTFAKRYHNELLDRGLLYPDLSPFARGTNNPHHAFAHAIAGISSPIRREDAMKLPYRWAKSAARHSANLLVSAEPIYRHVLRHPSSRSWLDGRRRYLDRLAKVLKPLSVEIIIVFRRPDDFIRSCFQESVMRSTGPQQWQNFRQFRNATEKTLLRYHLNVELFREFFSVIRTLRFDDLLRNGTIAHNFFQFLETQVADLRDVGVIRKSFTPQETMLKLFVNQARYDSAKNDQVIDWIQSSEVKALSNQHLGVGPFEIWESNSARETFLVRTLEEMERLRIDYFPNCSNLFPLSDLGSTFPAVPPISIEFKAALAQMAIFSARNSLS